MGMPTLNPPPLATPSLDKAGRFVSVWARWFQLIQQAIVDSLHPTMPSGFSQTGAVYQGSGVPSNDDGNDGDVYFRTDTPGTLNQRIYIRDSGAWVGIL